MKNFFYTISVISVILILLSDCSAFYNPELKRENIKLQKKIDETLWITKKGRVITEKDGYLYACNYAIYGDVETASFKLRREMKSAYVKKNCPDKDNMFWRAGLILQFEWVEAEPFPELSWQYVCGAMKLDQRGGSCQ